MEQIPHEFQGRVAPGKDWREVVAFIGDLPPMPNVAAKAMSLIESTDVTARELTDVLSHDTSLAARVLKIANSAMFSRQREIITLNQAIMIIGFKALKGIIVAATLRQMSKSFGKLEQLIWENSMCTAMCSSLIAKRLNKKYVDEIFLLGLLHSLGQIVLLFSKTTAKEYKKVIELVKNESLDYMTAESEIFGFAHPLIGALVAKKWNFSSETCQIILHYQDPLEGPGPTTEVGEKTGIIKLADQISHSAGIGNPQGYPTDLEEAYATARYVGFHPDEVIQKISDIIDDISKQFEKERSIYE